MDAKCFANERHSKIYVKRYNQSQIGLHHLETN